jgi:Rha family phage regulatory protein
MQLVTLNDNRTPVTTSLKVAESFGKHHRNVMRNIATLIEQSKALGGGQLNFEPANYPDRQKKPRPMFEMDRDAFMLVVMGFTGKKTLKFKMDFIKAFNAMEKKLTEKPDPSQLTRIEILKLAMESEEHLQVALVERDDAVRTKAWISDKKTASAMGTAGAWKKKYLALKATVGFPANPCQELVDVSRRLETDDPLYVRAKNIPHLRDHFKMNDKHFFRDLGVALRALSNDMGHEVKRGDHSDYGAVNLYHKEVTEEFMEEVDAGDVPVEVEKYLKVKA